MVENDRNALVLANQGLVYRIARSYEGRGLPRDDLVSEGQVGLIRAAEKFEPERGLQFSTYASYWIKQTIGRGVADKAHMVRVPSGAMRAGMEYNRLRAEAGHDGAGIRPAPRGPGSDCVRAAARVLRAEVSYFERSRFEDEHGAMEAGDPHEAEEDRRVAAGRAAMVLSVLPDREWLVLVLRHGLDGGPARTLVEVGRAIGITRQRARQIQSRAERRIRDKFPRLLEDD